MDGAVVSRPLSVRLAAVFGALLIGFLLTFIIGGGLLQSLIALGVGIALTAIAVVRASRIALIADHDEIVVRNLFRTYRLKWEDVSDIGVGLQSLGGAQLSGVVFRRYGESTVVGAQATVTGLRECRRVIGGLKLLRPDLPIRFAPVP
jgi:hypothetical protein